MTTMTEESARLLQRLMALCSRGEKCESEAYRYMTQRGATPEEAALAVEYLTENQYIDNARYARSYAADKMRFNKWGKDKIALQLRLKKVSDEDIQNAIDEIFEPDIEKDTITAEMAKKLRGIKSGEPRQKIWEKLMRFAIGRGYPMQICKPLIAKMISELDTN